MALARYQLTAVDSDGTIQSGASVTVTNEAGGALATLYDDRAGTSAAGNPVTTDALGFSFFYVTGGVYKIIVTLGAFSTTYRYVGIGTMAEHDFGDLVPGLRWAFDDTITDSDPTSGLVRFNHATFGSITGIYIDDEDNSGNDVSAIIDTWDDEGAALDRGRLIVSGSEDTSIFALFKVTGAVADGSGYRQLVVVPLAGAVPTDGDPLTFIFVPFPPVELAFFAASDAATIAIDLANGMHHAVASVAGNRTLGNPTNEAVKVGQSGKIELTADGTPRTIAKGTEWFCDTAQFTFPITLAASTKTTILFYVAAAAEYVITDVIADQA